MRGIVEVGGIGIGGNNPVRVQSMTNTATADYLSTANQIKELADAGSELVRFTVKDHKDAEAVPLIRKALEASGCNVPLIGDFHYNGHALLSQNPGCARGLDKYRINPGNVGFGDKHDENFKRIIDIAIENKKPVRIGVNFGSLDQALLMKLMDENKGSMSAEKITVKAMVDSALISARLAVSCGLPKENIILSAKVSRVSMLIAVYRKLAESSDFPLHLGLTEAGLGTKGIISSTAGLSVLLNEGIGDTIRVSLTPALGQSRCEEVYVAQQILQANGIRSFMPTVTSCPGCGRTTSSLFQKIAQEITKYLQDMAPIWRKDGYSGFEEMVVAVMGCVVNGPGESKEANIGLSLPGTGEDPISYIYVDGRQTAKLKGEARIPDFKIMIDDYVKSHYQSKPLNNHRKAG